MNNAAFLLPATIPDCALRLLARRAWFRDPGMLQRARLAPASRLARFLSGPHFSGRADIAAITLGRRVHFLDVYHFDPHSPAGLALLAHELKHVEQVERSGLAGFLLGYLRDYLRSGYGEGIGLEAEAYQFGRAVQAHLLAEMQANAGRPCCLGQGGAHRANPEYVLSDVALPGLAG